MISSPATPVSFPQPSGGLSALSENVLTPPEMTNVDGGDFAFDSFNFMDDIDSLESWSFM